MKLRRMAGGLAVAAWAIAAFSGVPAVAKPGDPINRNGLVKTFGDEFSSFSWYAEDYKGERGGGTWRTNFGYKWTTIDDIRNHTLVWNKEEQIYVDPGFRGTSSKPLGLSAISATNGILSITANTTRNKFLSGYRYTSGLITSEPTFSQTYGVFEMRAKLPAGRGIWPAFWLLPVDKTWPPEIDVMEFLGHETTRYYTTLHYNQNGVKSKSDIPVHSIPDATTGFHTYTVDWGPTEIIFYFDDKEVARRPTPPEMDKPFYILINLALGGDWAGSPTAQTRFPAVMQVDWVRVWRRDGAVATMPASVAAPKASEPVKKTTTQPSRTTTRPTAPKPSNVSIHKKIKP